VPGRHSITVEGFKGSSLESSLEMKVLFPSLSCFYHDIAGCNVRNVCSVYRLERGGDRGGGDTE
jgi:hypothetical protein